MIGGPEPEPTPDETKPSGFMVFSAEKSKTVIFLPKKRKKTREKGEPKNEKSTEQIRCGTF